ncbi:MAG: hypothetical protein MUC72_03005 [Acidobacteria bacterium]|jgi:hypothetical protein|nr:hypothetical protein [Acidobacteriota bacterium]
MSQHIKRPAVDPGAWEEEIQRRLRRAKVQMNIFDFLFLAGAAIAIFFLI